MALSSRSGFFNSVIPAKTGIQCLQSPEIQRAGFQLALQ
jgi:hypothetical protein